MNESAQFAEAVGEEPDSILLKKIVEDDRSSDFDDNEIDNEIDEEGTNLMLRKDDQVQLMDYGAVTDGIIPEEGFTDKIEPTCVSADVTQMALNEEECSHQEHPLLPATTEGEIACSTPKTPDLAPYTTCSSSPAHKFWSALRQLDLHWSIFLYLRKKQKKMRKWVVSTYFLGRKLHFSSPIRPS
jgi:hypothetical protein